VLSTPKKKKLWRDSLPIDMFLSAVSVLVVAQPSSEAPEGLMNYPVILLIVTDHTMSHSYNDVCVWSSWLSQTFIGTNTINPEVKNGCVIL
jgi:hypothetical protein